MLFFRRRAIHAMLLLAGGEVLVFSVSSDPVPDVDAMVVNGVDRAILHGGRDREAALQMSRFLPVE
jgi:hypothetical protein